MVKWELICTLEKFTHMYLLHADDIHFFYFKAIPINSTMSAYDKPASAHMMLAYLGV